MHVRYICMCAEYAFCKIKKVTCKERRWCLPFSHAHKHACVLYIHVRGICILQDLKRHEWECIISCSKRCKNFYYFLSISFLYLIQLSLSALSLYTNWKREENDSMNVLILRFTHLHITPLSLLPKSVFPSHNKQKNLNINIPTMAYLPFVCVGLIDS